MFEIKRQMSLISLTEKPTKVNTRETLKVKRGSSSSETVSNFITHLLARNVSKTKRKKCENG